MAVAGNFIIGSNDEHGLNPPTAGKRTPQMPYVERSFYENEHNRLTKYYFLAACSRCGFYTYDVHPEEGDTSVSERVRRVNRTGVSLLVTFGYNAYGSGATFNGASGYAVYYAPRSRYPSQSKLLAVDLDEGLQNQLQGRNLGFLPLEDVGVLQSVNCPSALVEAGFMTNFEDAKRMTNPLFCQRTAEGACVGTCDFLSVPYVAPVSTPPTLRYGNRGPSVFYAQYLLKAYGYGLVADGVYGRNTRQAIQSFQSDVGIEADGITGAVTWRYLTKNLSRYPTLRRGSRGGYVTFMQQILTSLLYPLGTVDGRFGGATANAVREFQTENGLTADGIVGANTWSALLSSSGRDLP